MRVKFFIGFCFLLLYACVEEIPIEDDVNSSINVEDILVIEATITDELKNQEIFLSRGNSLISDSIPNVERNAEISVVDEFGNRFTFREQEPGRYVSEIAFAVQEGVDYHLLVNTEEGAAYESENIQITGNSVIDDIYAERIISDNEVEGMAIFVDSSNPNGNLNDYRYTYEETYKIIAPNWTAFEFRVLQDDLEFDEDGMPIYPDVELVPREQEEQVCFKTDLSNTIVLADGTALRGNEITRNLIRFINRDNPIISHRYSILVKQLLQTNEAAEFYRTLLQFSQNEDLFSEIQPGLIEGNIRSENTEDIVIGFFSVASVTERRLFFNYEDFFPGEDLPPYFNGLNCNNVFAPPLYNPFRDGPIPLDECGVPRSLIDYIDGEEIEFFLSTSQPPGLCEGPYFVTLRACGDCTALGSNVVPEFWTEE